MCRVGRALGRKAGAPYFWWRGVPLDGARKAAVVGIEIAGVLLIVTTAFLGGQLVYELGVNVARAAGG